jgi:GLPGLI family protein
MMKKLITAAALMLSAFTFAQKEGSVTYVMTMEGLPPEQASMMGDMETKIVFKDKKTYSEMNSMMMSYKTVSDENGSLVLMDQMGNKYFMRTTKADMDKMSEGAKDPKIEYTNETKTIAGQECKKAIVTNTGKEGEVKTDVWYTEKIPYVSGAAGGKRGGGETFKGLKGMPLEFSLKQGPYNIKMTAKEVSFDKVPDSIFTLSTEGYTEKKPEDFKKGGQ